jgi:hypothetical protein
MSRVSATRDFGRRYATMRLSPAAFYQVGGDYKNIPSDVAIWLVTVEGKGLDKRYWPVDEIKFNTNHTWHAEWKQREFTDNEKKHFAIVLVGNNGRTLIKYFYAAGDAYQKWAPISLLIPDMVQATDVREIVVYHDQ